MKSKMGFDFFSSGYYIYSHKTFITLSTINTAGYPENKTDYNPVLFSLLEITSVKITNSGVISFTTHYYKTKVKIHKLN